MRIVRKSSPCWILFLWRSLCSQNELPEIPSESSKNSGFQAPLEDDDQPVSSYHLPVGGASADILVDIDERISSPPSGCS